VGTYSAAMQMRLDVIPTGKTTATVIMTQDQVDAIRGEPGMGRVMLRIKYAGETYRTSISRYRGQWMMVVNREMRDGGLAPGAWYDVEITRDDEVRTVEVPDDLAQALAVAGLTEAFDALAFTHRKEHVRAIEEAKKEETRTRRIEKCLAMLRDN